ncbi:ExbD/TolR family protein [Aquabacterium sp.]|uniref:ExbD/TolR family protein n=1 Tax=Aquabacterium sp. TaxID=1872578 RepID=UPI0035B00FF9
MLHFEETPPRKARIEIIPMIDVMMFLLIFFVLISLNVIPAFGLKTVLPDSSTAKAASSDQPPVVVSLAADGSVALDGQKMPIADLGAAAKQAHQKDARKRFVVSADHTVQWQAVVSVMDALRAQGIDSVTFATKRVQ